MASTSLKKTAAQKASIKKAEEKAEAQAYQAELNKISHGGSYHHTNGKFVKTVVKTT